MEKIEADNLLHRAFSVFLFNSKYELLLQVSGYGVARMVVCIKIHLTGMRSVIRRKKNWKIS